MKGRRQKVIEARLGESVESFLTRRIAAGQRMISIAQELGLDHSIIRYWIKKYNIPYPPGKPGLLGLRFSPDGKDTEAPKLRLKGEHVDICLCRLCRGGCGRKETIHEDGRCVFLCVSFSRKATAEA